MMHALAAPPDLKATLNRDVRAHAERLVEFLLRAVGSQPMPPHQDYPVTRALAKADHDD
jgi:hypothetical protein